MKGLDHRKKSMHSRNGRTRYEKGRRHHTNYIKGRNMLPHRKGDWANMKHSPDEESSTLADVWPA